MDKKNNNQGFFKSLSICGACEERPSETYKND
jgi:hypothetical protein